MNAIDNSPNSYYLEDLNSGEPMIKNRKALVREIMACDNGKTPARRPGLSKSLGIYKLGSEMDNSNLRDLAYEDKVQKSDS